MQRVQIKRDRHQLTGDLRQDLVFIRPPFGEPRQILPYSGAVGMEYVRPVAVHKNTILIWTVVGVTSNVIALFQNKNLLVQALSNAFSNRRATEPGTDNQAVNLNQYNTSDQEWIGDWILRVSST
jgi:hypothetical protein